MSAPVDLEIERPRDVFELLEVTFALYARLPWLFFVLAAGVVVPYLLIVLLVTGTGPYATHLSVGTSYALQAVELFLVSPLVSALHVHAVRDVREGDRPQLWPVVRRGLVALPVVSAAVIIATLGIFGGLLLLVVPGVLLALRWSVVAQAAALEGEGWTDALRRSQDLTKGNYGHVFGLVLLTLLIGGIPGEVAFLIFGSSAPTVLSFLAGAVIRSALLSFTALATALLFYDLKARREGVRATVPGPPSDRVLAHLPPPLDPSVPPDGDPFDPASWSDEDRPAGWYVDPDAPWNMRYWAADGQGTWSEHTAKTPKQTLAEWKDTRGNR